MLWEWTASPENVDYVECLVDACEHVGLLAADEVAQWRRWLADGGPPPPAPGNLGAAERHLETLLAAVPQLSRDPEPAALSAGRRFHAAFAALHASGVLSDDDERRWRSRALAVEAPWLDQDEMSDLSGMKGVAYAIAIPPASPEEEAADAAARREMERAGRRGRAKRVFVPDRPHRHDGLAIVAVITRTQSTEVLFHHVGEEQGNLGSGHAALEAFRTAVDALTAPGLEDGNGAIYEPVAERPVSSHGSGGMPDLGRPRVISGVWRYQPAASDAVAAFEVSTAGARWRLTSRKGQHVSRRRLGGGDLPSSACET